jgi:hypothetical protein
MFAALRRRANRVRGVEFCDGCGQVCTAACRAEAVLAENLIRTGSGGVLVLVEDAAEPITSAYVETVDLAWIGDRRG